MWAKQPAQPCRRATKRRANSWTSRQPDRAPLGPWTPLIPLNPLNYNKASNNKKTTYWTCIAEYKQWQQQWQICRMTNRLKIHELQKQTQYLLQNINELREHMVNLSGGFTTLQQNNAHKEQHSPRIECKNPWHHCHTPGQGGGLWIWRWRKRIADLLKKCIPNTGGMSSGGGPAPGQEEQLE